MLPPEVGLTPGVEGSSGPGVPRELGEAGLSSALAAAAHAFVRPYLEDEAVGLALGVHGRQAELALGGDVHLVARERVARLAELLDLGLEDLLQPLVLQLRTLHLPLQLCGEGRGGGEDRTGAEGPRATPAGPGRRPRLPGAEEEREAAWRQGWARPAPGGADGDPDPGRQPGARPQPARRSTGVDVIWRLDRTPGGFPAGRPETSHRGPRGSLGGRVWEAPWAYSDWTARGREPWPPPVLQAHSRTGRYQLRWSQR